jgi:hypothetical protein
MTIHLYVLQSRMKRHLLGAAFVLMKYPWRKGMGWLYMTNLKGHKTPKAYLDDQFTFAGEHAQLRVLRSK